MINRYKIFYCLEEFGMKIYLDAPGEGKLTRDFRLPLDGEAYTTEKCVLSISEIDDCGPRYDFPERASTCEILDRDFPPLERIAAAFPGAKEIYLIALRPHNLSCFSVCRQLEHLTLLSDVQVDLAGIEYLDTLRSLTVLGDLGGERNVPLCLGHLDGMGIMGLNLKKCKEHEDVAREARPGPVLPALIWMKIDSAALCREVTIPNTCKVTYSSPYQEDCPLHQVAVDMIKAALPDNPLTICRSFPRVPR